MLASQAGCLAQQVSLVSWLANWPGWLAAQPAVDCLHNALSGQLAGRGAGWLTRSMAERLFAWPGLLAGWLAGQPAGWL